MLSEAKTAARQRIVLWSACCRDQLKRVSVSGLGAGVLRPTRYTATWKCPSESASTEAGWYENGDADGTTLIRMPTG